MSAAAFKRAREIESTTRWNINADVGKPKGFWPRPATPTPTPSLFLKLFPSLWMVEFFERETYHRAFTFALGHRVRNPSAPSPCPLNVVYDGRLGWQKKSRPPKRDLAAAQPWIRYFISGIVHSSWLVHRTYRHFEISFGTSIHLLYATN